MKAYGIISSLLIFMNNIPHLMWEWLIIVSQCSHTFLPELHPQWAILQSKGYFMPCITAQQTQAWPHRWPSAVIQPTHCQHSTCRRYGWNGSATSRRFRRIIRSWNKQASCKDKERFKKNGSQSCLLRLHHWSFFIYIYIFFNQKQMAHLGFCPSAQLHLECTLKLSTYQNSVKVD